MLDLCWIVHNWPFRHCPRHLSPRQAPLISLTSPSGKNAATPIPRSRRLPQTSPQNTTPDDSTPHAPTIMQSLFASHGISTTWKLYEVVHRSRPHRPALHADHCCALSLFLYDFYLLAQSTTFILGRILNGDGCVVGDDNTRQTTVAPRTFFRACLGMGGKGGFGLIYWRCTVLWAFGGQRVAQRNGFLSLGVWDSWVGGEMDDDGSGDEENGGVFWPVVLQVCIGVWRGTTWTAWP